VDGVVITVCKGEQRPIVERAMTQLVTVGARVAGVVFNRASDDDISLYGSSSSQARSGRVVPRGTAATYSEPMPTVGRLGPLTAAVANCAPTAARRSHFVS